jgi:RNA ligase
MKPLGSKCYGSIAHLPGSRMGPADHHCHEGQERICLVKTRDKHDLVVCQEKLDGSCVGAAKVRGEIVPLSRAGYVANTSPYPQHHIWHEWCLANAKRFSRVLREGERIVGEWLAQAHGTRYELSHEPFVAFDLMTGIERTPHYEFIERVGANFITPHVVHVGGSISVEDAMASLGKYGRHGAMDPIEGAVWRVERNELLKDGSGNRKVVVDFLAKYVRPDKQDGCYLEGQTNLPPVWNWKP